MPFSFYQKEEKPGFSFYPEKKPLRERLPFQKQIAGFLEGLEKGKTGEKVMEFYKNLARDIPGFMAGLSTMALSGTPAGQAISPLAKVTEPIREKIEGLPIFAPLKRAEEKVFAPEKGLFPWEVTPTPLTEQTKEVGRRIIEGEPISKLTLETLEATPGIGIVPRTIRRPEQLIERPLPNIMDLLIATGLGRGIIARGKTRPAPVTPKEIPFPGIKEKVVPTEGPVPPGILEDILRMEKPKGKERVVVGKEELALKKELKKRGVTEKSAEIPKELEPLAEEARKYGTGEEFADAILNDKKLSKILPKKYKSYSSIDKNFPTEISAKIAGNKEFGPGNFEIISQENFRGVQRVHIYRVRGLTPDSDLLADFYEAAQRAKTKPSAVKEPLGKPGVPENIASATKPIKSLYGVPTYKKNGFWFFKSSEGKWFRTFDTAKYDKHALKNYPELFPPEVLAEYPELAKPTGEAVVSQLYKEGAEAKKMAGQKGALTLPATQTFGIRGIIEGIKSKIARVQEGFRKFRFYPEAPAELRNDIRLGPVQIARNVFTKRSQLETAIFGGLEKGKIEQVTRLIFARDAVARTKAHAGKPGVGLEEVTAELKQIEKSITDPKVTKAAENYKKISEIYRDELVRREKLEPGQFFEDYAPHLVEDYTPEWAPTFGIPRKMRIPYRPYTKKAVGTKKAFRQTPDVLLDHLAKIEWDNLIEDWLVAQANKYDIGKAFTREQKAQYFGTDKAGRVRPWAHSGRIIEIEGRRYRVFSPTKPFTRQLFPTEEGTLMALGREKRTYLVPENVYNTFERFSEPSQGSLIYAVNRANAYGKSLAILSHFTSFNFNNFIGDAFLGILQHPKKIQFLRNLDDGIRLLTKSPEKYTAYEKEFSRFLTDHAIIDATFIKELPYIYRSKNPLKKFLAKSQEVSQFRESIQRIANAKYLFDELKVGRGEQVRQAWDWINTEGLPTEKALGKIGRDSYVDYMAQSKTYNRWIRGFLFPFGTWYFKMSQLVHKMGLKHPIKVGVGLSALPTLAVMFNNRNDQVKEMERMLPDFIRDNRVHFVLGKRPDGTIRTLVLQTPQDALIGTKIFTIAINQANQVLNGEKSIQRGAIDAIKNWGIVEGKGILYLTTPAVRFLRGLIEARDPYDKQRIYPIDVSKLSAMQEWWYRFVYAQKCFMPFLTGYIAETEGRLKPKGQAVKDVIDNFIGLPALGVRDYNERTEVVLPGDRVIDWDSFSELEKVEQKEASIMLDIKQGFIKSGLMPREYYRSEEFKKLLLNLRNLHQANFTERLQQSLSDRITNEIENDLITFKMWAGNRLDMAKTDKEKRYWGNVFKKARTMQMLERLKYKPITVREHLPKIVEESAIR